MHKILIVSNRNLASNKIESINDLAFKDLDKLHDLLLANNKITQITQNSLVGLKSLQVL
jgi:Leucine-rich repeat (LRR) protein